MPQKEHIIKDEKLIKSLASGAFWVIIGMIIARILGYAVRSVIAHFFGLESYGMVNTALAMMTLISMISIAGLNTGLPRQISFYRVRTNFTNVRAMTNAAIKCGFIGGILGGVFLFLSSNFLAREYFKNENLAIILQIFSIGIPAFVLFEIHTSILKGYKKILQFAFYHDILRFVLILTFFLILGYSGKSIIYSGFCYSITYFLIILLIFFSFRKNINLSSIFNFKPNNTDLKLLRFSIPLMLSGIFWLIIPRLETVLIGGYLDQEAVGIYSAAIPVAQLILVIRQAFSPIILPLFTELLSAQKISELNLLYYISAKWTTLFAIPVFASMLLLPDFFINLIFGDQFLVAAPLLQIILIGYLIHTIIGPTSLLLIIAGKTKLVMINSITASIITVVLNIILLPVLGLIGTALISAFTYFIYNLLHFIQVYKLLKIQPFRPLHIKFMIAGILPLPLLIQNWFPIHPLIAMFCYTVLYFLILFLLKSFKSEDMVLINAFKKRFKK